MPYVNPYSINPSRILLVYREGQSNQNGFEQDTSLPAGYTVARNDVKIWNGTNFANLAKTNNMYPSEDTRYAAEFSFAWKVADATARTVYLVKHAVGSTSMNADWNISGSLYNNATQTLERAISYLENNGIDFDLYIMFNQGENDSSTSGNANAYQASYITHLTDRFRRFNPKGYICTLTRTDHGRTYGGTVHNAQINAINSFSNSRYIYVDCDDLDVGSLHYSASGYEEVGLRESNAIQTIL